MKTTTTPTAPATPALAVARIGAYVRIRRTALGATRAQLAERVGIPEGTLAAIEAGTYDPRMILGSRLESALELPPGSIDKAGSSSPR